LLFLAIADILPIVSALNPNLTLNPNRHLTLTSYRPGGGETIWPVRPAADLHPSADGSAVRISLVAGGG